MYRIIIQVRRDFWKVSDPNPMQSNTLFQVRLAVCTKNMQVGPNMALGNKSLLCPVQHATRHTNTSGVCRPVSIYILHTHKDLSVLQVCINIEFATISEIALMYQLAMTYPLETAF